MMRTISVNRRPIRELSLKHRSAGISALDGLNRRSNSRVSLLLLSNLLDDSDIEKSSSEDESSSDNEDLIIENNLTFEDGLGLTFISKVVIDDQPREILVRNVIRKEVTIESYSDDECWNFFRFRKVDLRRLMDELNFPHVFRDPRNRNRFSGEFSFLLFLRRMAYPGRLQDLEVEFGRDYTQLGRSINLTLHWLDTNHSFRINDNLQFWMPYQQKFADAVARKVPIPELYRNVNSFLDGTQKSTCKPSDGSGRALDAQRMWYSGYYRAHGFKMQSLMYPNGNSIRNL
jgi:hypothetical protein